MWQRFSKSMPVLYQARTYSQQYSAIITHQTCTKHHQTQYFEPESTYSTSFEQKFPTLVDAFLNLHPPSNSTIRRSGMLGTCEEVLHVPVTPVSYLVKHKRLIVLTQYGRRQQVLQLLSRKQTDGQPSLTASAADIKAATTAMAIAKRIVREDV